MRGNLNLADLEDQRAIEDHLAGISLVIVDNISTLCRGGREEVMKNDEAIGVPICETLLECLKKLQLNKVVDINKRVFPSQLDYRSFQRRVQRAFKEACVKAGLEDFHWHNLRHDFASMLVQGGTDIYTVQRLLGHKDGRMTQRYAHLSGENLRQAIKVLDLGKENPGHNLDTVASGS
ncbi:MAG: site-specific integrase [Nitrospinae bacterium]|nr:site-specific integrase [Nitrospinota bacterium]